jgi:hypothetical protein
MSSPLSVAAYYGPILSIIKSKVSVLLLRAPIYVVASRLVPQILTVYFACTVINIPLEWLRCSMVALFKLLYTHTQAPSQPDTHARDL